MKRRDFLTVCSVWFAWPVLAKTDLQLTPLQAEGPFYPVNPIALRSDLILNPDRLKGQPLQLSGRVVDMQGSPLTNITVEIWQCDGTGIYDHPRQPNVEQFDRSFAGCGATVSNSQGQFKFQTLYPVPYASRPPHIHVKLWRGQRLLLTTQLYLPNQMGNEWWGGSERELLQMKISKSNDIDEAQYTFVIDV
ncbi:protocatechuate 3,4-dioxygenase [Vibrio parahaemolyticus]|uniref:dioxygenase family protein n=1 Tax=Vibrio mediterranei TaxID=689 RepID=UPI00406960CE